MALSFDAFKAWIDSDGALEFDIYSQDLEDWKWIQEFIPELIVSSAGGMCPFQAEGLLHGLPFYFRERGGAASLRLSDADGEPFGNEVIYSASVEFNGMANLRDFVNLMLDLVPKLERSPYLWEFEGNTIKLANDNSWSYTVLPEREKVLGWGHTPEEGYAYAMEPSAYLAEHGCTPEMQKAMWTDREVNPTPINKDDRKFPAVKPDFRVNNPRS